jgi:uncharacterized Zn-finger protein
MGTGSLNLQCPECDTHIRVYLNLWANRAASDNETICPTCKATIYVQIDVIATPVAVEEKEEG